MADTIALKEKLVELAMSITGDENPDRYYPWLTLVTKEIKPTIVVEIGTALGEGAYHIATGLPENGLIYTIDVNQQLYQEKFFHPKIVRIHGDSKFVPLIENIDVLFIDGHHDTFTVSHDFHRWTPSVKSGGVIILDDVNMDSVARFLRDDKISYTDVGWLHSYKNTGFGFLIK